MKTEFLPIPKGFATQSIHATKHNEDVNYAPLEPPVVSSVNFKVQFSTTQDHISQKYIYSVLDNPTRSNLEHSLAILDGANYAICFSSGMATLSALLGMLEPGSHIICSNSIFGGTLGLLTSAGKSFSFTSSFVNVYDLEELKKAIQPKTALIWVEPISNPLMKVADIKGIGKIAKENNVLLAVDNSFLTPYFQRPLQLGADLVSYSLTKYINGHGDVVMGCLTVNRKDLFEKLFKVQSNMGLLPSPVDCSKVMRSLKTLPLRMKRHGKNAVKVARFLEKHPKILKVIHPGLPSHPQHELFKSQCSGHSGLVSFYVKAKFQQTKDFLSNLEVITPTASFGSIDSLIEMPMIMSNSHVPSDFKDPNVTENLIRISVGLEDCEDIINDLSQALEKL